MGCGGVNRVTGWYEILHERMLHLSTIFLTRNKSVGQLYKNPIRPGIIYYRPVQSIRVTTLWAWSDTTCKSCRQPVITSFSTEYGTIPTSILLHRVPLSYHINYIIWSIASFDWRFTSYTVLESHFFPWQIFWPNLRADLMVEKKGINIFKEFGVGVGVARRRYRFKSW